jgi:polysaccharide deacetylase family protein (PEP-CTERM system associated)
MINPNILTIDVEDWTSSSLHLLSQGEAAHAMQCLPTKDMQVERGVHRLIDFLEEKHFTATFFVLGRTAKAHKDLVRLIHHRGHEVGSHSMSHTLLPGLSTAQLDTELMESKKLLEDLLGGPVLGFRAPNLTGYPDISAFFHRLQSAGYCYDSSFTVPLAEAVLGQDEANFPGSGLKSDILEVPVTTFNHFPGKMPLGGSYLKLLTPFMVSRRIKKANENRKSKPAVLYFHSYEIDREPLRWPHPSPSLKARFSLLLRNSRKDHHLKILNYLSRNHYFTSIKEYLGL